FSYDSVGSRVTGRRLTIEAGKVLRDSIVQAETRGLRGLAGVPRPKALPPDSVYTLHDGPRTDVDDITKFWTNAYGAPERIRNALGRETRVWYDTTWPGLAKKVKTPDGLVSEAWYHATRALVDSVR